MLAESLPNRPAVLTLRLYQFRMLSYHPGLAARNPQLRYYA